MIIDMEVPKTCDVCPFADHERDTCTITKRSGIWCYNDFYFGHRPFWCPIKEDYGRRDEKPRGRGEDGDDTER
jgi:hypothetical protein